VEPGGVVGISNPKKARFLPTMDGDGSGRLWLGGGAIVAIVAIVALSVVALRSGGSDGASVIATQGADATTAEGSPATTVVSPPGSAPTTTLSRSANFLGGVTPVVPAGVTPRNANGDAAVEIVTAAKGGIGGAEVTDPDVFIDQPEGLAEVRNALRAIYPQQIGMVRFSLRTMTFTSESTATLHFDLGLAPPIEHLSLHDMVGEAVFVEGQWKVTRDSACRVWAFGQGTCPPLSISTTVRGPVAAGPTR
jgi:hypothetical protein